MQQAENAPIRTTAAPSSHTCGPRIGRRALVSAALLAPAVVVAVPSRAAAPTAAFDAALARYRALVDLEERGRAVNDDDWHLEHRCKPRWDAAEELYAVPAPTIAALLVKVEVSKVEMAELNDLHAFLDRDLHALIEADRA